MGLEDLFKQLDNIISDVFNTDFNYSTTTTVPNVDDTDLTYESTDIKKGKTIKTCVLYVDIRDSVNMTKKLHNKTMGKIYTAFTKTILKIAVYHNGYVRNIIGDRVMIVFPVENCFTNAVNCAVSINHVAEIMQKKKKKSENYDFKCGIGIDYGEMNVIKVGIEKKGDENTDNKNLIWTGYPANIASRLTDVANKTIEKIEMKITYNSEILDIFSSLQNKSNKPEYISYEKKVTVSPEEFVENIKFDKASNKIIYSHGNLINFEKCLTEKTYQSILITKDVFDGFKLQNPNSRSVKNNYWKKIDNHNIKNVSTPIYEANLIWEDIKF